MAEDTAPQLERKSDGTFALESKFLMAPTRRRLWWATWSVFVFGGALTEASPGVALVLVLLSGLALVLFGVPGGGRRVGRVLVIQEDQLLIRPAGSKPTGYREEADEGEVEIDGRSFPMSQLREIVVATREFIGRHGGRQHRYVVNIIARSHVIEVSTDYEQDSALALAEELSEALHLEYTRRSRPPEPEIDPLVFVLIVLQLAACILVAVYVALAPFALAAVGAGLGAGLMILASSRFSGRWLKRVTRTDAKVREYYRLERSSERATIATDSNRSPRNDA